MRRLGCVCGVPRVSSLLHLLPLSLMPPFSIGAPASTPSICAACAQVMINVSLQAQTKCSMQGEKALLLTCFTADGPATYLLKVRYVGKCIVEADGGTAGWAGAE